MAVAVPTYGENLRRLRGGRPQEALARAAGKARQANLPTYEHNKRFPTPELIQQHADMLNCRTDDLFLGVVTDFDRLRWPDLTDAQLEALLGGLSLAPKAQRLALAETGGKRLAEFLATTQPTPTRAPKLATLATAEHRRRGKRSA